MYDLSGKRFGRLTALRIIGKSSSHDGNLWECKCDCGEITIVPTTKLRTGRAISCGCYRREYAAKTHTKHNTLKHWEKKPRLYRIWLGMRERCYYPKSTSFNSYGARGITVCDEWRYNFGNFKEWALANGYKEGLSIDRINPNDGYAPYNCRWVTLSENRIRQRRSIIIEIDGFINSASQWAKLIHISPCRFRDMCKADIESARLFLYEELKKRDILPLIEK